MSDTKKVRLMLIGGFLGAGKTTLLARAASALIADGKRVGLITNDQAEDLVDTAILREQGFGVREIAGGCFCCRFDSLISASDDLIERLAPDVLIGEPVGSCTDLSATVLQPIKKLHGDRFIVSPFAVLGDPARLASALKFDPEPSLPQSVTYIYHKQLEEADLIVINKADTLTPDALADLKAMISAKFPHAPVLAISALTGEGVDDLLERLMTGAAGGRRVASVDYDTYAEGEALLGWSNSSVTLRARESVDWHGLCLRLLYDIRDRLAAESVEIAHLKLHLKTSDGTLVGNLTSSAADPAVRGQLPPDATEAELTLNARVNLDPQRLRERIESAVGSLAGAGVAATIDRITSFSPARPQPVHRFETPVD